MKGKVTIAPQVGLQVARITTLATPGVLGLVENTAKQGATAGGSLKHTLRGIVASIEDGTARISVHIIAAANMPLMRLAHQVQTNVANAISEIAGIDATTVDVTFEDVRSPAYPGQPLQSARENIPS